MATTAVGSRTWIRTLFPQAVPGTQSPKASMKVRAIHNGTPTKAAAMQPQRPSTVGPPLYPFPSIDMTPAAAAPAVYLRAAADLSRIVRNSLPRFHAGHTPAFDSRMPIAWNRSTSCAAPVRFQSGVQLSQVLW